VGIGASAGGLEAIGELFSNLPSDTGMAFLLVQHLQPDHPSMLARIIATKTAMPVVEAAEDALVEPNHVYVIPPDAEMRVSQQRIRLSPRRAGPPGPMPVDALLASLADNDHGKAIGVILSGTGSDGARGMQKLKEAGGLTFAQDEASASYGGMPAAAIRLGCVDRVLPPAAIAHALASVVSHAYLLPATRPDAPLDAEEEQLSRVFALLQRTTGVDFSHYKLGTVRRRIARRMALRNLVTLSEYLGVLDKDPAEAPALGQDLLIRVTSFFRDPDAFAQLAQRAVPQLLEGRPPNTSLRVWVPGCASGEELYSIGICLLEALSGRAVATPLQLFGTDVSEAALRVARTGFYLESVASEVSAERLQRFFVEAEGGYRISKTLRDLCVFAKHDITRDPPFSRIDLISCRNVLIYFDPVLQKRVIPLFHYALNPGGMLMMGSAEGIGQHSDLFGVLDARNRIYIKKAVAARATLKLPEARPASAPPLPAGPVAGGEQTNKHAALLQQVQQEILGRYAPSAVVCDESLDILELLGDTQPYLTHSSGTPRLNLRQMARPGLLPQLSVAIARAGRWAARPREPSAGGDGRQGAPRGSRGHSVVCPLAGRAEVSGLLRGQRPGWRAGGRATVVAAAPGSRRWNDARPGERRGGARLLAPRSARAARAQPILLRCAGCSA
jgi:two-component system CheB/CheR fusion protein